MLKYFLMFTLILFMYGCSTTSDFTDKIEQNNPSKKIYTYDICTKSSYISSVNSEKFGVLFSEYINLDNECLWNGFQRGYFEYLFKTTLKLKSFEILERKDFNNYEFSTYLIDGKYHMNLIYKYSTSEDMFIIDYNGKYSTRLIKEFDENYENNYLNKERFSSNYSNSLVKMNFINSYFSKEKEIIFDK